MSPSPTPSKAAPKTFADEPDASEKPPQPPVDEGFLPRGSESSSEPVGAFKLPETVQQRKPAPVEVLDEAPPEDGATDDATDDATDGATDDAATEESGSGAAGSDVPGTSRLPTAAANLDQKITWRAIPSRTRLSLRARFTDPKITRLTPRHNIKWAPTPEDTRVAKN